MWLLLAPTKEENMEAVNTTEVTPVKVAGFATRNANKERIEKEEEELRQLTQANKEPKAAASDDDTDDGDDSNLSPEDKSFKKRYGDLRRHTQKQQMDMQKQIEDLKTQLEQSTTKQIRMPKSEEELDQWTREFPDVAKIVETIAMKKAKEISKSLEERLAVLDEREAETARQKAEAELMRIHPDFDTIREQSEFHDWVESQPKWVQQALYENEADAVSAARAIDLYKADMGLTNKKVTKRDAAKDAAKSVGRSSKASFDSENEQGLIYESQVDRMSSQEYERNQEAIVNAIKTGKFVYDKSGSAR
jgi:hypothetical protein